MTKNSVEYTILDAKAAAGVGLAIPCQDFMHCVFTFATDGGSDAALTVKFQAAYAEGATAGSPPDFAASQTVTNMWDYVEVIDLQSGSAIDGDEGIAVATADDYRQVEFNLNNAKYICARVTARTEGEVTVKAFLTNNV